jgi:DNA-binding transcriptional regulator YiaG
MYNDPTNCWGSGKGGCVDFGCEESAGDHGHLERRKMYHYTECGLNNVWLRNGYKVEKTPYGEGVAIEDADGLHLAIGLRLVRDKPRLSGAEFRFLRKELDMSQSSLAAWIGKDVQSVARWEKSGRVPKMAERLLRAIYREHAEGNAKIIDLVNRLNAIDQQEHEKAIFQHRGKWEFRHAA